MAWTQGDIDTLKAAMATGRGVRTLTFADQSITFHSVDEMLKLLSVMEHDVAAQSSKARGYRLAATSKGV
jgi:hypothetical protein